MVITLPYPRINSHCVLASILKMVAPVMSIAGNADTTLNGGLFYGKTQKRDGAKVQ